MQLFRKSNVQSSARIHSAYRLRTRLSSGLVLYALQDTQKALQVHSSSVAGRLQHTPVSRPVGQPLTVDGMAYQQSPTRANIEFLKSSAPGLCAGRAIKLNYGPEILPPQLQGRLDPSLWSEFIGQVRLVADKHPYLVNPGGKEYSNWLIAGLIGKAYLAQNKANTKVQSSCSIPFGSAEVHRKQ